MTPYTIMVLDTETCDLAGNVYDVGYVIMNKAGEIAIERNWLVREIFTDAEKMMGAFYARKLFEHYAEAIQNGYVELADWADIIQGMRDDIAYYRVNVLSAYNLAFDRRVMRQTHKLLGDGQPIFQSDVRQLDIWRFACEAKLNSATYKQLAQDMNWVSEAGNLRTGAEYAYRFCRGDWGFIENHTALDDAVIESEILADCFRSKKRIPWDDIRDKYAAHPWRIPNTDLVSNS